ncbi:MAG: 30S ribosomal protein S4e [Promethearchaeia archaeon]
MVRRGQKKHQKRLPAPKNWPIPRKETKFVARVIPGPHPKEHCLTLTLLLREVLEYAQNMREVKAILSSEQLKVDGIIRKDPRFPVGLMDVVQIENSDEIFRLLPRARGGFRLHPIDDEEGKMKICRIERKMMAPGGRVQITLHDGKNILLPEGEDSSEYSRYDTLKISVPDQDILKVIPLKEGVVALVTRGKNVGMEGTLVKIQKQLGTHASTVTIQDRQGDRFETALDYIFALGEDKPEISLGDDSR